MMRWLLNIVIFVLEISFCRGLLITNNNKRAQPPILVSIEGNIGAGKSTLLSKLRKSRVDICFIDEPVGKPNVFRFYGQDLLKV